jgi:hypothetical protein
MEEKTLTRRPGFDVLARDLAETFAHVIQAVEGDLSPRRIAAE